LAEEHGKKNNKIEKRKGETKEDTVGEILPAIHGASKFTGKFIDDISIRSDLCG